VTQPFELYFTDGHATALHARRHGELERGFDWASLTEGDFDPALVPRARAAWTQQALSEYGTAVSMTQLLEALARAAMPLDLLTLAATSVTQELEHAELYSRLAMSLGGGAVVAFEPDSLGLPTPASANAAQRANELMVRLCCVGEAFSFPMLAAGLEAPLHPVVRAVLERVVAEESLHGRLGTLYLEWVADELTDDERTRLGAVATQMLAHLGRQLPATDALAPQVPLEQLRSLGWLDPAGWSRRARDVMRDAVVVPLARFGIVANLPNRL
jgi:hypothetical protein